MYLGTAVASIVGYFVGCISFSIIIVRWKTNSDVRSQGSKNAGATNASRIVGTKMGLLIVFLDMLKVVVAGAIAMAFNTIQSDLFDKTILIIPAFFAILGHCYPVYYKFRGGKAVSCLLGIVLLVNFMLFILFFVIFLTVSLTTKKISIASVVTAISVTGLSFVPQLYGFSYYEINGPISFTEAYSHHYYWLNFSNWAHTWNKNTGANKQAIRYYDSVLSFQIALLCSSILLIWKHRENLKRLFNKTEPNFFKTADERKARKEEAKRLRYEKIKKPVD